MTKDQLEYHRQLEDTLLHIMSSESAILAILMENGLTDEKTFERYKHQCFFKLEQEYQRIKEQREKEWREENPEKAKGLDILKSIFGDEI